MTSPLRQTSRFARPTSPFALVFRPTAATSFRVAWKSVLRPEFPSKRSSLIRGWPQREALRSNNLQSMRLQPRQPHPLLPAKLETQCCSSLKYSSLRGRWPTREPLYWGITATSPLSISLITQSPLPCLLRFWVLSTSCNPCLWPWHRPRPQSQPQLQLNFIKDLDLRDARVARRWTHAITPTILRPHLLLRWNFDLIFPVSVMMLLTLQNSSYWSLTILHTVQNHLKSLTKKTLQCPSSNENFGENEINAAWRPC